MDSNARYNNSIKRLTEMTHNLKGFFRGQLMVPAWLSYLQVLAEEVHDLRCDVGRLEAENEDLKAKVERLDKDRP